ncbi:MAG: DUF6464 family protein [Cyanobacteria bacterium J06643_4]
MFIALVIAVGLLPLVLSLVVGFYARKSFRANLQLATEFAANERFRQTVHRPRNPDEHYVDGMGLVIGDITCQLNARSPFIRCAANPFGPCEGCIEYEGREYS